MSIRTSGATPGTWKRASSSAWWSAAGSLVIHGVAFLAVPVLAVAVFFASPWPWWAVALSVLPNMAAPVLIVFGGDLLYGAGRSRWRTSIICLTSGASVIALDIVALAPLWH